MDNVAGVKIPKFEQLLEGADSKMALTGLSKGGKSIQVTPTAPGSTAHAKSVSWRAEDLLQRAFCRVQGAALQLTAVDLVLLHDMGAEVWQGLIGYASG